MGFSPLVAISVGVTGWDSPVTPVVVRTYIPRSSVVAVLALLVIGLFERSGVLLLRFDRLGCGVLGCPLG